MATAVKNKPIIFDIMLTTFGFTLGIASEKKKKTIPTKIKASTRLETMLILPSSNAFIVTNDMVAGPVRSGVAIIDIKLSTLFTLVCSFLSLIVSSPRSKRTIPPAILNESTVTPNSPNNGGPYESNSNSNNKRSNSRAYRYCFHIHPFLIGLHQNRKR